MHIPSDCFYKYIIAVNKEMSNLISIRLNIEKGGATKKSQKSLDFFLDLVIKIKI